MFPYRLERLVRGGGVAVLWWNQSGVQNAIRIFATEDQAKAWIYGRERLEA